MHPMQQDTLAKLAALSKELDDVLVEYEEFERDSVVTSIEYEKAYARTFLSLDGSVELRKQQALLDTWQERMEKEIAETQVKVCKERIRKLHAQLEVHRSINAAQRTQFITEPIGQFT
jgi:hypothetical protein